MSNHEEFHPGYVLAKGVEPGTGWRDGIAACSRCSATIMPRDDCWGTFPAIVCVTCHRKAEQLIEQGVDIYRHVRERLAVRDCIVKALRSQGMSDAVQVALDAYQVTYHPADMGAVPLAETLDGTRPGDVSFWVEEVPTFGGWRIMVRDEGGMVWVHNHVWPGYAGKDDEAGARREADRLNAVLEAKRAVK